MTKKIRYEKVVEIKRNSAYWDDFTLTVLFSAFIIALSIGRFGDIAALIISYVFAIAFVIIGTINVRKDREINTYWVKVKEYA